MIVIAAFPGTGKIYTRKSVENIKMDDLNPVNFKYLKGKNKLTPNPDYPNNYIAKIKELATKENGPDIVSISYHQDIRDALCKAGIEYFVIYPPIRDKEKFITQYKERGNSERFITKMDNNWNRFIDNIINDTFPIHICTNIITESLLNILLNDYNEIVDNSKAVSKSRVLQVYNTDSVNWSIISKDRRNWSVEDFAYKNYIDWDMLCKFGKLPEQIITNNQFAKYINWKYLDNNKQKYSLKIRKLISKKIG